MILTPEKPINLTPFTVSKDFSVPSIAGHYETTMNHEFTVNSANPLTRVDRVSISDTKVKIVVRPGMSTPIQLSGSTARRDYAERSHTGNYHHPTRQ